MAEFYRKINFDSVEYISQWPCLYLRQSVLNCKKIIGSWKKCSFVNMSLLNSVKPISKTKGIMHFTLSREIT